jgi:ribosomal protein S18 acetylase RimI-like enzyme
MTTTLELTYRHATSADVDAVVDLVTSAYRGEVSRQGWTTEADLLDGQRTDATDVGATIAHADSIVLLGFDGDVLRGCCHIQRDGDACYFGMFSVDPAHQGGGAGKLLLAEAERIALHDWLCTGMKMTVIEGRDELVAWYERRGYRRTGEFRPFPYGDERFGIPKRDNLRFEWLTKPLVRA